jgi:hypothetical protein
MAEKEYIEREALIQYMQECKGDSVFNIMATGYAYSFIENAPAVDVVEVVRCKDCKHFQQCIYIEQQGMCQNHSGLNGKDCCVSEGDFCSYGERKADND